MSGIYVRIHTGHNERILAACDEEIIGQTFSGNGAKITVTESFYNGELVSEEAFIERMKSVTIMNLVGERTVGIAIMEGHVSKDRVMDIGDVKHAQVVKG
jgi:uncharacterized protein